MQPKAVPAPNAPKELGKPLTPAVQISRVRYSPDGKTLAAACFDGTVKLWLMTDKEPVELPPITGCNGWVTAICFSSKLMYTTDSWGQISSWNFAEKAPKPTWKLDAAHDGWVRSLALSPDGSSLATCGKDGFVRLWNAADGKKLAEYDAKADVLSVVFAPNGKSVWAGDLFGVGREIESPAGKVARTFEAKELYRLDRIQDVGGVKCLMISGDGKTLFAAGGVPNTGGFVQAIPLLIAFDLATGKRLSQYKGASDNEGYVTDLAWHPAGYVIGTTSGQPGQGKFFFWKPGDAAPFFMGGKHPNCHSVALHPDGTTLAVSATNANSSGNGRVKGTGGEYPGNSSPIQLWTVPKV